VAASLYNVHVVNINHVSPSGSWIAGLCEFFSTFIFGILQHDRLEICTMCNAWDKYKSRVPRVLLGTSTSLTYMAQYSYSILSSYVGQV